MDDNVTPSLEAGARASGLHCSENSANSSSATLLLGRVGMSQTSRPC
jgi:hypothetical protein